ncbi:hemerythrin-like domain-containing protein [Kineothrix alysoides]|uniref:Hemerythrin-like domain-containing protein n=1 Tax=Kineothrix alysoides TaxID=1469948 RepID=A0A4R1QXZ5_9FIRM|nr:hemerythrin domain-containing protein [Kineothrix alysoides]TCL57324.1 hemerythrin-like domain-containing protein [Kineothrix alysoides]
MYSVELMVEEHKNILKLLTVIQKACCGILNGQEVDDGDFRKVIEFARNYADKHHHGKEEQILFQEMTDRLGQIGIKLIQQGMLVEHDLGRLHISELEKALDQYKDDPQTAFKLGILTEAMGYVNLLRRHIDKEDQVVYTYAEKNLPPDILESVDQRVKVFEAEADQNQVQEIYLKTLQELEAKYLD